MLTLLDKLNYNPKQFSKYLKLQIQLRIIVV